MSHCPFCLTNTLVLMPLRGGASRPSGPRSPDTSNVPLTIATSGFKKRMLVIVFFSDVPL
jgi:hypothetical protein